MKRIFQIALLIILTGFFGNRYPLLAQEQDAAFTVWLNGVEVPMQTFVIENGKAYLNGIELNRSDLPPQLPLEGVELRHTFFGESLPFTVGGRWFSIENNKVVPYNQRFDSEREYQVFMEKQAQYYEPIQRTLQPLEGNRLLFEIKDDAPDLFEMKMKESFLENQTRMLGVRIQVSPEGGQRREMVNELREMLDRLFELKIENQEEEIRQLSQQLVELRTRVADRKKAKEQIIEQRLHELIGQENQ